MLRAAQGDLPTSLVEESLAEEDEPGEPAGVDEGEAAQVENAAAAIRSSAASDRRPLTTSEQRGPRCCISRLVPASALPTLSDQHVSLLSSNDDGVPTSPGMTILPFGYAGWMVTRLGWPASRSEGASAPELAAQLEAAVDGEVRFDAGSRALYATDASNYRHVPIGVVSPRTIDDVVAAVDVCCQLDVPVLARGGGTSLAGQTCNAAVVLDLSRHLHGVEQLDPDRRQAVVLPGTVLDDLRSQAEEHRLTFGPDPATHNRCTLGGMVGNNSCGVHSMMAGTTSENVDALEVLTYDGTRMEVGATSEDELHGIIAAGGRRGEIYRGLRDLRDRYGDQIRRGMPDIPRHVSGFGLQHLLPENGFHVAKALVGSEGTCSLTLRATLRLVDSPPHRVVAVLGFPDVFTAADHVPDVVAAGPIALEGLDDKLLHDMHRKRMHSEHRARFPQGGGWLLAEFGGDTPEEAEERALTMKGQFERQDGVTVRIVTEPREAEQFWTVREAGLGATARVPGDPDTWPGWEDAAVAPERLGDYLRRFRPLLDEHGLDGALYGHFGEGCVHTRIAFDLVTPEGIENYRRFITSAAELVTEFGGSLSGEHGDGQARADLLPIMYGPELVRAFGEFKHVWDPAGRMNPGKVVDPRSPTADLRLGVDYEPPPTKTFFAFPNDDGDFARATQRCVGVGLCRRDDGEGVMCPSYMVTHEEQHSTRGRAHLLFELLSGRGTVRGWRDPHVKEALDLCLACKGCKSECPVNVDVATYKAEFLAHYYRGRLRPRPAYALGLVMYAARVAQRSPRIVNAVSRNRFLGRVLKSAGGVAPDRTIPQFAEESFVQWFRRREGCADPDAPPVMLWPDTFTDHFEPAIGRAAVTVLESTGHRVVLPPGWVCCGRPLYDFGFLRTARRLLRRTVRMLRDEIRAGVPLVVLEPSCGAVFRDELAEMLPHDRDARRLASQTFLLSEFLERRAPDLLLPPTDRSAIVQPHCHHRSVMGFDADEAVLQRAGLDADVLDAGCCGMAGAFGYEEEKYEVSMACGERKLFPAIRQAEDDVVVLADGFSCRQQIHAGTGRRSHHLAEILAASLDPSRGGEN